MDLEQLLRLIDAVSKSALTEFRYEERGVRIRMGKAGTKAGATEVDRVPDTATAGAELEQQTWDDQEKAEASGSCLRLSGLFMRLRQRKRKRLWQWGIV